MLLFQKALVYLHIAEKKVTELCKQFKTKVLNCASTELSIESFLYSQRLCILLKQTSRRLRSTKLSPQ